MKSIKPLDVNLNYVPDTSLHKYEYFDEIIKSGNIKDYLGLNYNIFVSELNKEGEYTIFHYILLLNNNNEIKEKQFKNTISAIRNINFVKILLKRKDVVGDIPLHYIIKQGNQPLVFLYNQLFKFEFSSCLNIKNLQENSPLDILKNNKQSIDSFVNNSNNNCIVYKVYKKINNSNKIVEKFLYNIILLPEVHTKNFYSMVDMRFQQLKNMSDRSEYRIVKKILNSQENILEPDLSGLNIQIKL